MIILWGSAGACDYPLEKWVVYPIDYAGGTKQGTYGAPTVGSDFHSIAYDALITRISAILFNHKRIPNPYEIGQNSDGVLRQGFGLMIQGGRNVMKISCNYEMERTFGIVICRESLNTDHDADGIASVEKQLMEDLNLLIRDFEANTTLNTGLIYTGYLGDNGIQLRGGKQSFLYMEAQFSMRLIQQI